MDSLIDVDHVSKTYVSGDIETPVLLDITLRVYAGDYIALMGPSGSGKSTLLNIMSGLDNASSGSIVVKGEDITALEESALSVWRLEHIGFIFQQYHLMKVLTAFENIELPLLLFNLSRSQRRKRAEAALSIVGLEDRRDYYPRQLSGGQQQRLCIARAIVTDPIILIADEPTGNLDYDSTDEVLELFRALNRDLGKTIIMVTHDPHVARQAGTIHYLQKGYLSGSGEPDASLAEYLNQET